MTDPAPPARTPLTPEDWARRFVEQGYPATWSDGEYIAHAVREAMAQSFAEGRLAGLEEAAVLCDYEARDQEHRSEHELRNAGDGIATAYAAGRLRIAAAGIRGLAEDGPKAPKDPKTPAIPAGKQG